MKILIILGLLGFCDCSDVQDSRYSNKYNDGVDDYTGYDDNDKYDTNTYNDQDWKKYDEKYRSLDVVGLGKFIEDSRYSNKYNDGVDDYTRYDDNDKYDTYSYNDQDRKKYDEKYRGLDFVGLGKFDREDIYRPCALNDWQCIRQFFADNSKCKPTYGPIPDPVFFERNTVYYAIANITVVLNRLRVTGLASSKISEFYVNKDTGNLVFAINFQNLNETSPNVNFRYKRTAKESIVLNDFATVDYTSGTFTAVIPKVPHLRLDLAEIHADINNAFPPFFIGPKIVASTDPDVVAAFAQFLANVPIIVQEIFLFQAQLFMSIFIQTNICDFGLKLTNI